MALYKSEQPCPRCPSSDAYHVYFDEDEKYRGQCFSCGAVTYPKETAKYLGIEEPTVEEVDISIQDLPTDHLRSRRIHQKIAEEYGVKIEYSEETREELRYYFPVYKDDKLVAYKVRNVQEEKGSKRRFFWHKVEDVKTSEMDFFGSHVGPKHGQAILLTAGFEDAMAADQMIQKEKGKKYKCRSILDGVGNATKEVKKHLEYLSSFNTVFICFDQDEHEQAEAKKVAELLPIGTAKIVKFSEHDANDMLKKSKHSEFVQALSDAAKIRPDGIVAGQDTWELIANKPEVTCFNYPWYELNRITYGFRLGELVTFTSGSGSGKTQIIREMVYYNLMNTDFNIGVMALEEPVSDTVEGLMSLYLNKRIHLPDVRKNCTEDELREAWEATAGSGRVFFLDHFGSTDEETLFNKIRFMAKGLDCKIVVLDHLSIAVSEYADQGDERKTIDAIMSRLKKQTQEFMIYIALVCHLRKSGNKPFELGEVPSLDDLRSSGAIKQLSNGVIAIARNQQAESETIRNTSSVHVLKNRFNGSTGPAGYLYYNDQTGRLEEIDDPEEEEAKSEEY